VIPACAKSEQLGAPTVPGRIGPIVLHLPYVVARTESCSTLSL